MKHHYAWNSQKPQDCPSWAYILSDHCLLFSFLAPSFDYGDMPSPLGESESTITILLRPAQGRGAPIRYRKAHLLKELMHTTFQFWDNKTSFMKWKVDWPFLSPLLLALKKILIAVPEVGWIWVMTVELAKGLILPTHPHVICSVWSALVSSSKVTQLLLSLKFYCM